MIEIIILLSLLAYIYSLNTKVDILRKELSSFKKALSIRGTVSLKTSTSPKIPVQKEQTKLHSTKKDTSFIKIQRSRGKKRFAQVETQTVSPWLNHIKNYFTSGNIVVRVGGLILFFGLAFLAKYTSNSGMFSIEARLLTLVLFSFLLTGLGWRLRKKEGHYGLILQGLGIGIFYLVVFVSTKLYILLPASIAFIIMLVIVIFGSLLAIVQNALPLAIFAIGGGFLAPILTSDGTGSHIALFTYYTLLNSAIVGIAWYRSWRVLNLMGFVFTFVIATAWGILKYEPTLFISTEPFLILFFIFYLSISIFFAFKQEFELKGIVDSTLVFGLPSVVFVLQATLVSSFEYGEAISAVAMGTLYLILSQILKKHEKMALLSLSFLSLGVIFYTLAIPYVFDAQVTGVLWALEAAALIWVSLKQKRFHSRMVGQVLHLVAIFTYVTSAYHDSTANAFINSYYIGYLIIIVSSFFSSYTLYKHKESLSKHEQNSSLVFLCIAFILWLFSAYKETLLMNFELGNIMLVYTGISALILSKVALKYKWDDLSFALQGYLGLGILYFIALTPFYIDKHPFAEFGVVAILLFFTVHYAMLYLFEKKWSIQSYLHIASLWIVTLIFAKEVHYAALLLTQNSAYVLSLLGLFFILMLTLLTNVHRFLPSPYKNYLKEYKTVGSMGIMLMFLLWELFSLSSSANPTPLPYMPLLNPLAIIEIFGIYLIYKHFKNETKIYAFIGVSTLVLSVVILARAIHNFLGVEYTVLAISHDLIFQMSLSILWSLMAMFTMFRAHTKENRTVWIAGAVLMGIVVAKLFVVELAKSDSVERIISFIAVGLLLLILGYFAPLPPAKKLESIE